jgi:hypothetical protein
MSRYIALAEHLKQLPQGTWEARFDEIERVIGGPLPKSAYLYPAWWANQAGPGHSQTRGWRAAGWRTARLDLAAKQVSFEREARPITDRLDLGADDDSLMREAQRLTGIEDRASLIREALSALIAREAGRRLASLGGSMPGYRPAPRDRPTV